ncbi:metallopeptidase family protein [Agilicoccus flavus]|uniref:metallopeptidase family protein n=1 Tax=Agilicoccus flavus TaxID=2775968 RepID=UPI001CF66575|nr:metallopeptidase family protein [Agilicoccus flavus]
MDSRDVSREEFEDLVGEALDEVPAPMLDMLDNVAFFVEDEPADGQGELLGLYEGTPLTQRYSDWGAPRLPDRILLFRGPLTRAFRDLDELRHEIAVTIVHEMAHHLGIEEDRLHELGWG